MTLLKKLTRAAVVAAVAAGTTVGLAAVPAQAAPAMSAGLEIRPYPYISSNTGKYWVIVWGVVPMSQQAAQNHINSGVGMQLRLWGEDPAFDNLRKGPYFGADEGNGPGQIWADTDGLHFSHGVIVKSSILNEDSGWYEGSGDELYVGARMVNAGGTTLRSARSTTVHGDY